MTTFREYIESEDGLRHKVMKSLEAMGWEIQPTSEDEIRKSGIDAWISKDGKRISIHIKHSHFNEFVVETIRDWTPNKFQNMKLDGRDMIASPSLYISLDSTGATLFIADANEVKEAAIDVTKRLQQQYNSRGARRTNTTKGEARIVNDPRKGSERVIAFITARAMTRPIPVARQIRLGHPVRGTRKGRNA